MALEKLDIHLQKNESECLSYTIYKNQFWKDLGLKYTLNNKLWMENISIFIDSIRNVLQIPMKKK